MDPNAPIKYSDLFEKDDSIQTLQSELKALYDQYKTLMEGIKAEAASVKNALTTVSGATSSGQDTIKTLTALTDKLAKKRVELAQSTTEEAKELIKTNQEIRENNNLTKLSIKLAQAKEGSFNALSAQWSINQAKLKAMSAEERANVAIGGELEKQNARIFAEMKRLQEATGRHTLSVGDYGVATANLASDIRNGIQALTQMRIEMKQLEQEGQKGGERWTELSSNTQRLANDLKELKRQYQIVKLETNALGQQTGYLNDAIGVLSTGSGGLSALTGTINMFGGSAAGAAEALVQLNSAMAIANGLSQIYNGIFKSGNLLLKIRTVQTNLATVAQNLQTKSTIAAKAAQVALNAVAKANPYIILASVIAGLVTVLIAWVSAGARAVNQQKLLNQQVAAGIEYTEAYRQEHTRLYKENQKALEQELAIAKARKAGYAETQKLENQIQAQKEKNNEWSKKFYEEDIANIEANRKELERLRGELYKAQSVRSNKKVEIQFDAEGPARRIKASKVIDIVQEKINNLNKKVEIAAEIVYDDKQLEADAKALREQHRQEALEIAALERGALRSAEDVQIALLNDRFTRERAAQKANIARQIVDLKVRLQTENNLTLKARKAINEQIKNLQKQLVVNLENINNEEKKANITAIRELEDTRLSARRDTAEKQRTMLKMEYDRDIEDIEFRLATEKDLTETEIDSLIQQLSVRWAKYEKDRFELENQLRQTALQKEADTLDLELSLVSESTTEASQIRLQAIENQRQQELTANRALVNELRQDEALINAKYDRLALQEEISSQNEIAQKKLESQQKYETSVFNLREHSEEEIYKMQLNQQKERLRLEIEGLEKLLAIQTGEEKVLTEEAIETLKNEINAIDREMKKGKKISSIWELFGFSSDVAGAIQTVASQIHDSLKEVVEAYAEAADAARKSADSQVEAAQKILDAEIEARQQGYASREDYARRELDLARETQAKAIEEQKKAQKAQAAIDSLTQASSLVTASANIWKALSGIEPIGPALAIAAITAMWGSFAAAKIKANEITSSVQYGEGTVELLQGGSHASGRDIDLGRRSDGTHRRAEGGEYFAVVNKRNSTRYGSLIPEVINSFNNGTFAEKFTRVGDEMAGAVLSMGTGTDITRLEKDVRAIKDQGTEERINEGEYIVIRHKNLIRRIKS